MPALTIVEDFEVLEDGVGKLHPSALASPVQQLDLHSAPERLDDRVIETITDRAHRRQ
jgi:hypothetical protein